MPQFARHEDFMFTFIP
jgi:hypothetical protein